MALSKTASFCDGDCPSSCSDNNACTTDSLIGAPETCDAVCQFSELLVCISGDGCCPSGCDSTQDNDCQATCGNGIVEDGELCDGDCPSSCSDNNACTTDSLIGSPETCDAVCQFSELLVCISGDGCCPSGCDSTQDNDCQATCGNGIVEDSEFCDHGSFNTDAWSLESGCNIDCSRTSPHCGDGIIQSEFETCDTNGLDTVLCNAIALQPHVEMHTSIKRQAKSVMMAMSRME